jgi:hypothetical protein
MVYRKNRVSRIKSKRSGFKSYKLKRSRTKRSRTKGYKLKRSRSRHYKRSGLKGGATPVFYTDILNSSPILDEIIKNNDNIKKILEFIHDMNTIPIPNNSGDYAYGSLSQSCWKTKI